MKKQTTGKIMIELLKEIKKNPEPLVVLGILVSISKSITLKIEQRNRRCK